MNINIKSIDERKFELEEKIRHRELDIREKELQGRYQKFPVYVVPLVVAVLTFLGGVIGTLIASNTNVQLERKKFESSLILSAVKTENRDEAIQNLKFFVKAGFLNDSDGKISSLSDDELPYLGSPKESSIQRALSSTGNLTVKILARKISCAATLISRRLVISSAECSQPRPESISESHAELEFKFSIGQTHIKAEHVDKLDLGSAKVAIFRLSFEANSRFAVQSSSVRKPKVGEVVYMAFNDFSKNGTTLRECSILEVNESTFSHSCTTAAGASGALMIAAYDDGILGMHFGRKTEDDKNYGLAVMMLPIFGQVSALLVNERNSS